MWCVIECSCDGEIFEPDFFDSKEEAAEFIKDDATECYRNICDLPEANINIRNNGLSASVNTDEYSWVWKAFDISDKLM